MNCIFPAWPVGVAVDPQPARERSVGCPDATRRGLPHREQVLAARARVDMGLSTLSAMLLDLDVQINRIRLLEVQVDRIRGALVVAGRRL